MISLRTLTFIIIICFSVVSSARDDEMLPECYMARVVRVVDGDTFHADVYSWLGETKSVSVRIAGIDAPERDKASTAYLKEILTAFVSLCNIEEGVYCRIVANVFTSDDKNIGDALIAAGHAQPWEK